MTKTIASMNIFEIVEMMRMTLKTTEGGNNQEKMKNKLGLSCAKLRASLDLSDSDKILVYVDRLAWFLIGS